MIRRTTWVLLGILVILLGVAWYLQRNQQSPGTEVTPSEQITYLFDSQGRTITGLRVADAEGKLVEIVRGVEASWVLNQPTGQEADVSKIETVISLLGSLQVLSTLEPSPPLDAIGLEPVAFQISVFYEDGAEQTIQIGEQTPTASGFYVKEPNGLVQIVESFGIQEILDLLTNPPVLAMATSSTDSVATGTMEPVLLISPEFQASDTPNPTIIDATGTITTSVTAQP